MAHEVGHVLFADGAWPERDGRPIDPPSLGVMEATGPGRRWFDPHPTPIARYRQVHGRLSRLASAQPRVRDELAAMPTPDQVARQMRAAFGESMR